MAVDQTITRRDETQRRDEMMVHGVRGLLIINGGGAIALLIFLQAIWGDFTTPRVAVIIGLIFLVVGTALAGAVMFIRYDTTFKYAGDHARVLEIIRENQGEETVLADAIDEFQRSERKGPTRTRITRYAAWGSLLCFLAGTLVVVIGALSSIPS